VKRIDRLTILWTIAAVLIGLTLGSFVMERL
jgi:uncharacterized protein YneF (UPF0154 family)